MSRLGLGKCNVIIQERGAQKVYPYGKMPTFTNYKEWYPYVSPHDPCPPMKVKTYSTPPQLYLGFQPPGLPQFEIHEALRRGTLWKALYSDYDKKLPH